jgi:hypothetical protein
MNFLIFILGLSLLFAFYMLGYWDGIRVGKVQGAIQLRDTMMARLNTTP